MIKYVELTAPNASAFRQAKILSIECAEGDYIKEGDTLFVVQSGSHKINLPSTQAGRVVEMIATVQENITISTALLLLETKNNKPSASKPITETEQSPKVNDSEKLKQTTTSSKKSKKASKKKTSIKQHQQQSLDLLETPVDDANDTPNEVHAADNKDDNEVVLTNKVSSSTISSESNKKQKKSPTESPTESPTKSPTMSSSSTIKITVPDIGADSAKVIEILVNKGDTVAAEDPLVTLESDKASMDVPSTHDGVVSSIAVDVDQDVNEGTVIIELETQNNSDDDDQNSDSKSSAEKTTEAVNNEEDNSTSDSTDTEAAEPSIINITIPDIGGDSAKVIEILVDIGDEVDIEDPLVTLESDKASMDVPSSAKGVIKSIEISIDQEVSEGDVVATLESMSSESKANSPTQTSEEASNTKAEAEADPEPKQTQAEPVKEKAPQESPSSAVKSGDTAHASPSIRRFARELGVELAKLSGTGRKGRITKDDVKAFVKESLSSKPDSSSPSSSGAGIPSIPPQDFSKFGDIDVQPLNKIKKLTASNLHRAWLNVPHVTHNDESNISDLEEFRKQLNAEYAKTKQDIKLSPLAFIVKAMVNALQKYPQFNSSLEAGGENLIYKKYFNIGIAVETPNGLVVPVIKNADKLSVAEIAVEMGELAKKARDKKLTMNDMSGACITISSLGGIGGTGFTPIVNAPEVAILGVSRSKIEPVWNGEEFKPGMILPLSLSYDHRVIDGAEAARFTRHIAGLLEDIRRLTV